MSQYIRESSGATPERIAKLRAKFKRRQRRRDFFNAIGTPKGAYAVFMTGMAMGLLVALVIWLLTR